MPYTIDWFDDHTVVVFNGQATYAHLRQAGECHYGDRRFDDLKYVIMDFTRADLAQMTLDRATILASIDSATVTYKPKLKLALVIVDEHQRTLSEQYIQDSIAFHSSWNHRIFSSVEDARAWCEFVDPSQVTA